MHPIEIRHRFVTRDGVRLHVAEAGAGDLLVFLHGYPESWRVWRPLLHDFARDHRVAAPDNRGFFESDKPPRVADYAMDEVVADIDTIATACGANAGARFTLIGHDWGGIAAWHFAARFPDRLRSLVILNAPHPTLFQHALQHDAAQRLASQYAARLTDPGAEARLMGMGLETYWNNVFGAQEARGLIRAEDKAACLAAWAEPGALTAMLNWYRASGWVVPPPEADACTHPIADLRIDVPTLVLWGMDDTLLLPSLLDGIERLVPRVSIERLAGLGHGLVHEAPALIGERIRAFLKHEHWRGS